jgi:phosphatidylglycerophosphate synthase
VPSQVPSIVSLLRVPLAGLFFVVDATGARVAIIGAAAATDFADGWIARRYDVRTKTGAILDPVTDKIFLLSVLAAFAAAGELSLLHLVLLVTRDVFAILGFLAVVLLRLPVRMRARFTGKVVTSLQLAAVAALTVLPGALPPLAWTAGLLGVWAVLDYARAGRRDLRRAKYNP